MKKEEVMTDILHWAKLGFWITPIQLAKIVEMVESKKISSTMAKKLIADVKVTGRNIVRSMIYDQEFYEDNWVFDFYFACYKED